MAMVTKQVAAPPSEVWAVLADGWSYASWVVGTAHVREVDDSWPAFGSVLHHTTGVWPLVLQDRTEVIDSAPERQLSLRVRGWPAGEAKVDVTVQPVGSGTQVTIEEQPSEGPGRWLYGPIQDRLMAFRLEEMVRRLAALAEGRATAPR
jgi:hypothetical protein